MPPSDVEAESSSDSDWVDEEEEEEAPIETSADPAQVFFGTVAGLDSLLADLNKVNFSYFSYN